ncbi:DUF4400 domain-containing protein [Vibrio sp. 10N.222.54.A1]|uniref:DUF4400 domain-containing protein n=1 Tax=Vibrio cyclitrophicus TaxID=47951 RepID=A0A7Z1MGT2_9VIBR|nr:hypothetical protein BCS91_25645 [Vibrio cyclitrophicus]PMP26363.1 hypothetical protein BCS90_23495 [Vibrio cyclitrophicus]
MVEKTPNPPVKREEPTPWYGLPFVALGHLFWIWVLLILIEWVAPLWGQVTGQHAKTVLVEHITLLQSDQPHLAAKVMGLVNALSQRIETLLSIEFDGALAFANVYWHGVVYVTLALFVRVALLFFSWPLFLLASFLGAFDGLISRQRRTAFVGRETETTHYYARRAVSMTMIGAGYLWLFIPGVWPLSPTLVLLPAAGMTGLLVRTSVASYKKYL